MFTSSGVVGRIDRIRHWGRVPVAILVVTACNGRRERERAPPLGVPDFELVCDDPAVAAHEPAPAAAEDILFSDDFVALDPRWSEFGSDGKVAPTPPHVVIVADGASAHGVALVSPGLGGIHARIAVARTDALLVTARVRSFAVERGALLCAANCADDRVAARPLTRAIAGSDDFTEWSVVLAPCRDRKAVQVSLVPGDHPLAVDRIEVRCLRPVEGLWLAEKAAGTPPLPRGRHRADVAAMDLEMEGCFVPTRAALRWRALVPDRAPRLDLETALIGGDAGGAAEWTVAVDGVALAQRREAVAAAQWTTPFTPWTVALDRFAGREVVVELRCSGDRTALGFAGAPRVLGGARAAAPPNVILISLDTLRPDRIGPQAGGATLTPNIDRLAARGTSFSDACSTSSWTLPAQASLMTGQHPLVHGAIDSDRAIDSGRSSLLAERFQREGYATAAFTAGAFLDPRFGFANGFEVYSVRDPCGLPHDAAAPTIPLDPRHASDAELGATPARAFDWVRRHADTPFFLFLHTYHVHEYDDDAHDGANSQRQELIDRATAGEATAIRELARRYDECVKETDHDLVGGLLDLLERLRLDERTLIAIVSDHGEEFLEHGGFRHGLTLRDEVGSVALVVAGPGVPRGAVVDAPVSLTGVAPALARLAGLPPDPRCTGKDLFLPPDDEPRAILLHLDHYCTAHEHVRGEALWIGDWQVQRMWSASGAPTLSFERRDAASGRFKAAEPSPEQRAALERRLDAEIVARLRSAPPVVDRGDHELPETLRERLKALGYTGD
jgi:arylsulfatase A-like enzyme